jgi:hypothetical protein
MAYIHVSLNLSFCKRWQVPLPLVWCFIFAMPDI